MKTLFIAVGHRYRHDDGVALELAARLRAQNIPGLAIAEASDDMIRLVDLWSDYDTVVICDAVYAGEAPGTIYRRDPVACRLPRHWFAVSSHQLGVPEAIELGRAMKRLPSRLLFIGIEARDFSHGEGLTPEVERALTPAMEVVRAELARADLASNVAAHT
jgi:hydrogenase maturation protease